MRLQQPIAITLRNGDVEKGYVDAVEDGAVQLRDSTRSRTWLIQGSAILDFSQF